MSCSSMCRVLSPFVSPMPSPKKRTVDDALLDDREASPSHAGRRRRRAPFAATTITAASGLADIVEVGDQSQGQVAVGGGIVQDDRAFAFEDHVGYPLEFAPGAGFADGFDYHGQGIDGWADADGETVNGDDEGVAVEERNERNTEHTVGTAAPDAASGTTTAANVGTTNVANVVAPIVDQLDTAATGAPANGTDALADVVEHITTAGAGAGHPGNGYIGQGAIQLPVAVRFSAREEFTTWSSNGSHDSIVSHDELDIFGPNPHNVRLRSYRRRTSSSFLPAMWNTGV